MSISEQVKELREYADGYKKSDFGVDGIVKILYQAANTIEALSATLNNDEEKCRYEYAEVYHIGETVNKLHELCGEKIGWIHYGREIADSFQMINRLCNIIESLSIKLQAANMERSAEDCGGWIPCKERLPQKDETVLIDTGIGYFEIATYSGDGKTFYTEECGSSNAVAWQPLPEPYHEP